MEKRKRQSLGIQKKRKSMKRNTKGLVKDVIHYLKSDSYMFAPLVSPPPSDFVAPKIAAFSATEMNERRGGDNKSLLKKIEDYLKSDSYMYAPLIVPQPITSQDKEPSWGITTKVSVIKTTLRLNQRTVRPTNVTTEGIPSKGNLPETSILGRETLGQTEMVKHMVHQNCRSSSVKGHIRQYLRCFAAFLGFVIYFFFKCE
ncbi:hypothetical protein CFOL_v3_12887 [Cephalotus follicularis]|uniref:Uncharacterized protein n=1 Tax=Cephalotus follicularis TaxID=3775 RepID=A0A1Q3BN02_CEPFO|nr:hypothetical protein CFOL_v3_12887 [Cephalotus follicularis]